ncbi:hypothetical protein ACOSQ3_026680 [Xanthoceras sorbifolium]
MSSSSKTINIPAIVRRLDVDNRIPLRFYYRIADDALKQAGIYRAEKNIIDLYVMLLRFSSLVSETIPHHRDYRASLQSNRVDLKKKLLNALNELEELKPAMQQEIGELNRKNSCQINGGGNTAQNVTTVIEELGAGTRETTDAVGPSQNGSIFVILTDPEVLDCFICFDPLTIPVFQCENGHVACSSCCSKLGNKCPSCCSPIGHNRCRAIEKVLESVKVICANSKYGCKETMSYSQSHDHEKTCRHAPCSCPLSDCCFVGSSSQLYQHFIGRHNS